MGLRGLLLSIAVLLQVHDVLSSGPYTNPVIAGDYPDPGAMYDPGTGLYWVATTSGNAPDSFPIQSSPDLIRWNQEGAVFPSAGGKPVWAVSDYWAPEIHAVNGVHVVYFTARNDKGMLSIGAAVSSSGPRGPYVDSGAEVITSLSMGYIDPTYYYLEGTNYLIFKEDGNDPAHCPSPPCPTNIYITQLDATGTKVASSTPQGWQVMIRQDEPWEGDLVEAPFVVRDNGFYYLFYSSGGGYNSPAYSLGVARSANLTGPYTKYAYNPVVHTPRDPAGENPFWGSGHCSVVSVRGGGREWWYVYHAWNNNVPGRNVVVDRLVWREDLWPVRSSVSFTQQPPPSTEGEQGRDLFLRERGRLRFK